MAMDNDELAEAEIPGFDTSLETLFTCNMDVPDPSGGGGKGGKFLIQVTSRSARLVDAATLQLLHEFIPPAGTITVASANSRQVLLACGAALHYLEIVTPAGKTSAPASAPALACVASATLDQEVAAISLRPLVGMSMGTGTGMDGSMMDTGDDGAAPSRGGGTRAGAGGSSSLLAAVATWTDSTVRLVALPMLQEVSVQAPSIYIYIYIYTY